MKKIFAILFTICFIFGSIGVAGACWGPKCDDTADLSVGAAATSIDEKYGSTYNDSAYSAGTSYALGENEGSAIGTEPTVIGGANANSRTDANAKAFDLGLTSATMTNVKTEAHADAFGMSKQKCLFGDAENSSYGEVNGEVLQSQGANEVGYASGTFASGGNTSGATFSGKEWDKDHGIFTEDSHVNLTGKAETTGFTVVTVDPYGNHQTASAITGNMSKANVYGADKKDTNVWGEGGVSVGAIATGRTAMASAGGNAGFSYDGNTMGGGLAGINAAANVGNSASSSAVTGFAGASSN